MTRLPGRAAGACTTPASRKGPFGRHGPPGPPQALGSCFYARLDGIVRRYTK